MDLLLLVSYTTEEIQYDWIGGTITPTAAHVAAGIAVNATNGTHLLIYFTVLIVDEQCLFVSFVYLHRHSCPISCNVHTRE